MLGDEIMIIKDVNLISPEDGIDNITTLKITKMTEENYKIICSLDVKSFNEAYRCYTCDICDVHITKNSSIYTNTNEKGVDVCSDCLERTIDVYGLLDVYNLKNILICERNRKDKINYNEPIYNEKRNLFFYLKRPPSLSEYKGINESEINI